MSESNGHDRHVFLCVPNAGSIMPCCLNGISQATRKHKMSLVPSQFGDIPHNFNMMWTIALNMQEDMDITHIAMIHTDIKPAPWWVDTLMGEMDRVDADVMSAVIAIKDHRGLTTTGIRRPGIWGTRRFTMAEIFDLPETFSIANVEDVLPDDAVLAINTGLWICRFPPGGWPAAFPGFRSEHRIVWRDGRAEPEFDSEDWLFSDWAASRGLRVFATRTVQAAHVGAFEFGNDTVWGSLKTDEFRPVYPAAQVNAEWEEGWSMSRVVPAEAACGA